MCIYKQFVYTPSQCVEFDVSMVSGAGGVGVVDVIRVQGVIVVQG